MRAQPQVPSLCIDETSLSCGELYTVVTNRAGRGGRGTLVTMIRGTKSEDVIKVLEMIHVSKRKTAKEVTLDLFADHDADRLNGFSQCHYDRLSVSCTLIPQYYCKLNLLSRGCVKTLTHLF